MITLYNTRSNKFDTSRRNSEVIANLVAERNGGKEESRDLLIDILSMIHEESRTGMSSEVALTLLENDIRFRGGELFCSRKQAWSIGCGATELGLNLNEVLAGSEPAKETISADVKPVKAEESVSIKPEPVVPVWTPDYVNGCRIGDTVAFADTATGELVSFKIVATESCSSSERGVISKSSPVGQALLGHLVEDMVDVQTPSGSKKFQIVSIARS